MLVVGFAVGAFQANCYLLATGEHSDCVIIDPGQDAAEPVADAIAKHDLNPVAVLATHGHFDHIYSAADVADKHGAGVYIHPADRHLLADPLAGIGPQLAAMFAGQVDVAEPSTVIELDGGDLDVAGMHFTVDHAPGHTPGSVLYRVSTAEGGHIALTGDVLFKGAIGRTDLPGGDGAQMQASLENVVLALDDETVVLPGHGEPTTIGAERGSNPFLVGLSS